MVCNVQVLMKKKIRASDNSFKGVGDSFLRPGASSDDIRYASFSREHVPLIIMPLLLKVSVSLFNPSRVKYTYIPLQHCFNTSF
jgi:hypothetical protein